MQVNIDLPFQIGDKIWVDKTNGFGSCNFMERYKNLEEAEITHIKIEYDVATKEQRILYKVTNKDFYYIYNGKVAYSKEEYYDLFFRKELEELIPEDLRTWLWK